MQRTFRRTGGVLVSLMAFLIVSEASAQTTWFVDAAATTGSNNGTSWTNAWTSLQSALTSNDVDPGDLVKVAQGTYKPHASTRSVSFVMKRITLEGGYAGVAGGDPDFRDPALLKTILSGDLLNDNASDPFNSSLIDDNSHHVVTFNDSGMDDENTILDGVWIRYGNADGEDGASAGGGGILCSSGASPRISNCWIEFNTTPVGIGALPGAGFYIQGSSSSDLSSPVFIDCVVRENRGGGYGGGGNAGTDSSPQSSPARSGLTTVHRMAAAAL